MWIMCLSTLPADSGTLISKLNAKCTFIWKEDFGLEGCIGFGLPRDPTQISLERAVLPTGPGQKLSGSSLRKQCRAGLYFGPLSNIPVLFLLIPGKMLLTMFRFQKWLGSAFPEDVWAWWLLIHWLQLQFTPCEALPSVWIGFAWQYSQACGHPCCLCTFSYPISSFQSTLHLICFDTALLEQPINFSDDPLWLTLFVEGVNDRLLDHYHVSSVPHYCAFKEQEIPRMYTVWMVIYLCKYYNILRDWFLTFISCTL